MLNKIIHRSTTQTIGQRAENIACDYLQKRGLNLVARNFRCRLGEIDLIMREKNHLVFIEVRWRRHLQFGSSSESVDYFKQKKLLRAAEFYLQKNGLTDKTPCRFDVIAITEHFPQPNIEWIINAFSI